MTSERPRSENQLRTAQLIRSGNAQSEAIDRGNGIWESRGIGNSYLVTTSNADVLINAGTLIDAKRGKALFQKVSGNPIEYIVLTQSHANQYGGLEIYKTEDNEIIAHRLHNEERDYSDFLFPYYSKGSRRIFRNITGDAKDLLPTRKIFPDILINDEGYEFSVGGRHFQLIWTPGGEARSALIVWLPEERVAIVGNLFGPLFGNHPNLNTLRGDKPRSAMEFINSVKRLRSLNPVQILTGHEDIRGEEYIAEQTTKIIDAVQWVHDETIQGMNAGKSVRTLMRDITMPPDLELTEEYGKLSWNVRAIFHEYSGWFDPSAGTTDLYDVPYTNIAPALAELIGSLSAVVDRADRFVADGKPLEALYLLELVSATEPNSVDVTEVRIKALKLLGDQTGGKNLWERQWIASQITEAEV